MIRSLKDDVGDAVLAADVCVIGAGPVGIAAALTLVALGVSVVLIESGGRRADPQLAFRLANGMVTGDPRFGEINARVSRGIGGTSWRWVVDLLGRGIGVRYAAFEHGVLARGSDTGPSWPLSFDELRPWYGRALEFAGLRGTQDELEARPSARMPGLEDSMYVFGRADAYHVRALAKHLDDGHLTVLTDATVTELIGDDDTGTVRSVRARHLGGREVLVSSDSFVLAAGAIDSTRLLLAARDSFGGLRDNEWLGRNLMDRPRLYGALSLAGPAPDWFGKFALHHDDGRLAMHRLISDRGPVENGSASTSLLLAPEFSKGRASTAVSTRAHELLMGAPINLLPRLTCRLPEPVAGCLHGLDRGTYRLRSRLLRTKQLSMYDTEWADWGRRDDWAAQRDWRVTAITEQMPSSDNEIVLDAQVDEMGVRRAHVRWGSPSSITEAIEDSLQRAGAAFEQSGVGTISWQPELAAVSSCHMMGTIAIGRDPGRSAADPLGLVRGTSNVYVCGNAALPQSGHSNPTLTAMALAARTATHISGAAVHIGPPMAVERGGRLAR